MLRFVKEQNGDAQPSFGWESKIQSSTSFLLSYRINMFPSQIKGPNLQGFLQTCRAGCISNKQILVGLHMRCPTLCPPASGCLLSVWGAGDVLQGIVLCGSKFFPLRLNNRVLPTLMREYWKTVLGQDITHVLCTAVLPSSLVVVMLEKLGWALHLHECSCSSYHVLAPVGSSPATGLNSSAFMPKDSIDISGARGGMQLWVDHLAKPI